MNNIFKALNVKNQEEMDKLIESLDLNDSQYITFYSALNENMDPEGIRFMLENITKEFYNGSYEKLVEQYKEKKPEREFKKIEDWDIYYGDEYLGHHKLERDLKTGKGKTISITDKDGKEEKKLKEYTEVVEPKHKIGDRVVTTGLYGWNYAGGKIVKIIPPSWQDGDEAHYSYIIKGIMFNPDGPGTTLSDESISVPVETLDTLNEDTVYDHSWYEVKGRKYPKRTKEGVIIKEDVAKINPKVLDELYEIISDQMGNMYLANYDEVDFDKLLDSVDDFGNDIDGYNPALKKDYALALKAKWEKDNKDFENDYILDLSAGIFEGAAITEAKEVIEEPDTIEEEPLENEKSEEESLKDSDLASEIAQIRQIVDTTANTEVLSNLLQQVEVKLPLTKDTEQMNELAELKQDIETKMKMGSSIKESYEYNPDDEEYFEEGDQVIFNWDKKDILGKVVSVRTIGGNRYYQVASRNEEDGKIHNYMDVDPIDNEMRMYRDTIDDEYKEANNDTAKCDWCGEEFDKSELKKEKHLGYLCNRCARGIASREGELEFVEETAGTCAGCITPVGKPAGKIKKRKKKSPVDEIENHLFKEYVLNDVPCEVTLNGHKMKFFENEGKWYMSVDNALVKTFDKKVMMETADEINYEEPITADLLEGYSCYEMNILMEDGDNRLAAEENPDNQTSDDELANILSASKQTLSSTDEQEIKKQNIQSAKDMNLKNKGQNVNLIDPKTSMEKDVKFIDADEEEGIGYIQDEKGEVSEIPMNLLKSKG